VLRLRAREVYSPTLAAAVSRNIEPSREKLSPVKKTPKNPAAPKKRGRGRPRKDGHGRVPAASWLPTELLRQLDAYVAELQKDAPGASRGDVLAAALKTHRPFRRWLLKISSRRLD
jgi:hypothetical protein